RAMIMRQEGLSHRHHVTLENLHDMLAAGTAVSLKVILKVDVMGSLAPLENAINELSTGEAKIEVLHSAVGAINETDITLADASDAIVIGFGVTADPNARKLAEERGVDLRTYEIIYEVVDEMRKALEGKLKPIEQESIQGHLQVRQTFKISKVGTVAGCFVGDGIVTRNSSVRLIREGKPIWHGKLDSLKRVKEDVREVREGFECGVKLDGYDDVKVGDIIESYTVTQVARTLDGAEKK
ncbi:MAG: translation initiation factor IF-2, partial [Planctomycetota bacterium]|nr:translation initiation factor IF-2 [Planctomycetota bacterium]